MNSNMSLNDLPPPYISGPPPVYKQIDESTLHTSRSNYDSEANRPLQSTQAPHPPDHVSHVVLPVIPCMLCTRTRPRVTNIELEDIELANESTHHSRTNMVLPSRRLGRSRCVSDCCGLLLAIILVVALVVPIAIARGK
jgi:hypothetical protein